MRICDRCGSTDDLTTIEIYNLQDKGYGVYSHGCKIMQYNDYQPDITYIDLCPECLKTLATINTAFINNEGYFLKGIK